MSLLSSRIPFGLCTLLGVTLLSGTLSQHLSSHPLPPRYTPGAALHTTLQTAGFPLLTLHGLADLHRSGQHLFLDARSLAEYQAGHIPGAMSLPVNRFDTDFPDIAPLLDPDAPLIVYCGNPDCDQALRLAQRLREAGYTSVSLFPEGYEGWANLLHSETRP